MAALLDYSFLSVLGFKLNKKLLFRQESEGRGGGGSCVFADVHVHDIKGNDQNRITRSKGLIFIVLHVEVACSILEDQGRRVRKSGIRQVYPAGAEQLKGLDRAAAYLREDVDLDTGDRERGDDGYCR